MTKEQMLHDNVEWMNLAQLHAALGVVEACAKKTQLPEPNLYSVRTRALKSELRKRGVR